MKRIKRIALPLVAAAALTLAASATAFAGQPADPGCFGTGRAEVINTVFKNGGALDTGPGASEWGHIAASRGSTNGDQNRAQKTQCGGDATH